MTLKTDLFTIVVTTVLKAMNSYTRMCNRDTPQYEESMRVSLLNSQGERKYLSKDFDRRQLPVVEHGGF